MSFYVYGIKSSLIVIINLYIYIFHTHFIHIFSYICFLNVIIWTFDYCVILFLFWSYIQSHKAENISYNCLAKKLTVYVREIARHISICQIVNISPLHFVIRYIKIRTPSIILLSKLVLVGRFVSNVNNLLRDIYLIVIFLLLFCYTIILYYCCVVLSCVAFVLFIKYYYS